MEKTLDIQDLGQIAYAEAFDLQLRLHKERIAGKIPDTLLLLEHPHVYTLGRHANDNNIVWQEAERRNRSVEVRHVDRGGDVTYHGPGQLVGYPIIKLEERGLTPRSLVAWVENLIIRTVAASGIASYVHPEHPGVWVGDAKICAIGMRIKERVSYHGFALNVNTDLSYFEGIVPCGIQDKSVCSIKSLIGKKTDMDLVKERLIKEAMGTKR
ncbi:MAG: lipoyl(octanoyl) transferase LipB [Candidatus Marinimicrobia bacterium]|nr:lipoyl(octanoyl) transferase LipB [Candidatus Neomarinimicrobiota bacterium]